MKLVVLCLNDFPVGVYSSLDAAERAKEHHRATFQVWRSAEERAALLNYHTHVFGLDAEAKL